MTNNLSLKPLLMLDQLLSLLLLIGSLMKAVSLMDALIAQTLILITVYSVSDMVKKMERNITSSETLGVDLGEKVDISDLLENPLYNVEPTLPQLTVLPVLVTLNPNTFVDSVLSYLTVLTQLVLKLIDKFYMF